MMISMPTSGFEWPAPWELIPTEDTWFGYPRVTDEACGQKPPAESLADELQREVCPAHALYRMECVAVARNGHDPNEFLFLTTHKLMPLAFVHLTWTKEEGGTFPWVEGYQSWEEFRAKWTSPSD